jgi:histidyl-tRNA synthetase
MLIIIAITNWRRFYYAFERKQMTVKAVRGTIDITPEEIGEWHYIEHEIRRIMDLFNYKEIRTPIFEHTELFQRGVGEETDIVTKEMYTFPDKGGRSLTLRPEGTAAVVRSCIEKNNFGIHKLNKLYYIAPMFRYERPQAGRLRQHHQFGVEAFGSERPEIDIEVIALASFFFECLGLNDLQMRLNSVGCAECRPAFVKQLKGFLEIKKDALCQECVARAEKNTLRVLDCKNEHCKNTLKEAPIIADSLCAPCAEHFSEVKKGLEGLGIHYVLDSKLVRGLDYYTRTTFEVVALGIGAQDAVAGGGRYDNLVKTLGGPETPGIGFGSGMERLIITLGKHGIQIPQETRNVVFFALLDHASRSIGVNIIHQCRRQGVSCETDFLGRNLKAQLKAADKCNARFVVIIGEDEIAVGKAKIKDFVSKEQIEIELSRISEYLIVNNI